MKFKLGDFVRFVDERMEGYITRIINHEMVGVTGEDDFEIPVLASKITMVHGHGQQADHDDTIVASAVATSGEFKFKGVYLVVADDKNKPSVVHFHVHNDTSYQLMFGLTTNKLGHFKGEFSGVIAPGTITKIYSASLTELDLWPSFNFQALYYSTADIKQTPPLVVDRKFKAKDFSGAKKQVALLDRQAWVIQLDEPELVIDVEKIKESFFKPAEEKAAIEKPGKSIDLHIEKLRDDHQFLSPSEILAIQLDFFHKSLDAAIVHKLGSIVFIHGVGNGTLRHEIHKTISKHAQVKTYMDAGKEKFGYGATEVILK